MFYNMYFASNHHFKNSYTFLCSLELYLQNDVNGGLVIDDIIILLLVLLFADDMAIVGKTPCEIQNHLDNLYTYSTTGVCR